MAYRKSVFHLYLEKRVAILDRISIIRELMYPSLNLKKKVRDHIGERNCTIVEQ